MPETLTHYFTDVTLYRAGWFGVGATKCKTLKVTTGVHYAQYTDAIELIYLEKGKRLARRCILDCKPWFRVVDNKSAISVPDPLEECAGGKVSRYTSFDPRYITDFEDKLVGVPVLMAVGEGDREKCMRCVERIATTDEGGSHVCGVCAGAIRQENE